MSIVPYGNNFGSLAGRAGWELGKLAYGNRSRILSTANNMKRKAVRYAKRIFKRSRPSKKYGATRKDYQASTGGAGIMRSGFKRKRRMSRRAYKRKLFNASADSFKHRSLNSNLIAESTPVSITQMRVVITGFITDSIGAPFWTTAGGLVPRHFDSATTSFGSQDLFVRGGRSTFTAFNGGTIPLTLTLWKMITRADSNIALSFPATVNAAWEPSLPTFASATSPDGTTEDPWRSYKFWGAETVILQPGQTFTRVAPIKSGKLSTRAHNLLDSRQFWLAGITDMDNAGTSPVTFLVSHNLSFTGDLTN